MPPRFSATKRVRSTDSPPIPLIASWAADYDPSTNLGRPLIGMSQGVPGSPPNPSFTKRLSEVVTDPSSSKYGAILGDIALRESLADDYKDVYGQDNPKWGDGSGAGVQVEDFAVVCGANMAFMATIMTLCEEGDEVIIPFPSYFNQTMTMTLLSVKPVLLYTQSPSFIPTVEDCRKLISPRTKAITLVTPNNPTGAIYPPETLAEFAGLAREHSIALILDETYRDFLPPIQTDRPDVHIRGKAHRLFDTPLWRECVISMFSFSKSYAIPGHRLGVLVADPSFLNSVSTVLDCMQINPPRPSQIALAPIMKDLRSGLIQTSLQFTKLLAVFSETLSTCPGWEVLSSGAFYAFVAHPFKGHSSLRVCEVLAKKYGVMTLPGTTFAGGSDVDDVATINGHGAATVNGHGKVKKVKAGGQWLRFAVANVAEDQVRAVGDRLRSMKLEDLE
ncbi:1-aminocyclopropane-1-carboxylate synthase, and related proteins [Phaffia rhodozyma]|uniref:1-aminocyclopropane-1-carboxylate synthase, and related proteins n=1 Tax=Phaffia rhodozyma TaxID=264483 RepID=A0A0F7SLJ2_PHARH|nr:1-aminocyclopropane-1-carboxylate synthase, and related proteins [Phaffia rhodozyma]